MQREATERDAKVKRLEEEMRKLQQRGPALGDTKYPRFWSYLAPDLEISGAGSAVIQRPSAR